MNNLHRMKQLAGLTPLMENEDNDQRNRTITNQVKQALDNLTTIDPDIDLTGLTREDLKKLGKFYGPLHMIYSDMDDIIMDLTKRDVSDETIGRIKEFSNLIKLYHTHYNDFIQDVLEKFIQSSNFRSR